jgi:regulator of protease activity HflC (stomatin/prohibitin superfamily)
MKKLAIAFGIMVVLSIFSETIRLLLLLLLMIAVVAIGFMVGTAIILLVLPYIPTAIERLSNKPNRYRGTNNDPEDYSVSEFGFFTPLAPGQVKLTVAGDHFIRCVMRFPGHTFKGYAIQEKRKSDPDVTIIPRDNSEYWEVVSTTQGDFAGVSEAEPIEDIPLKNKLFSRLATWWARKVFHITGYVFVGIYPFRKIYTFRMERFTDKGEKRDYSDHFRVQDFQFPVHTPAAETKDIIPVSVDVSLIAQVFNPFMTAFHTDNWPSRLEAATQDCVKTYAQTHPLDEVLAAKSTERGEANALVQEIKKIDDPRAEHDTTSNYGIRIKQVLIPDISPTEPRSDTGKKLADEAFARVEKKAMTERAQGEAAKIREQAKAVNEGGYAALAALAAERDVRTAEAAGEHGLVIVGSGRGDSDPINMAMLHELRRQNRS